jgi:hypothetical protein
MNLVMIIVIVAVFGWLYAWPDGLVGQRAPGVAVAAESLNVEGLPKDPKAFRAQVDQIIGKVDALLAKLKSNPKATPMVLDLMQTRDNILREILKMEVTPDGAKWTLADGRASIEAMLRLLKEQYDKAAGMT